MHGAINLNFIGHGHPPKPEIDNRVGRGRQRKSSRDHAAA